jgi:hypothetical protein
MRNQGAQVPKRIPEKEMRAIESAVRRHGDGATAEQIASALSETLPRRTLQHRLRYLVSQGRLVRKGERRWARYLVVHEASSKSSGASARADANPPTDRAIPFSPPAAEVLRHIDRPIGRRKPIGYNRDFLDSYCPNQTMYLTDGEKAKLSELGRTGNGERPAGTYAQQILGRLLIDLSWNSSRLEGNTYSLLDTQRLIELGEAAEGKPSTEAQMILNHKAAIEFLVEAADEIGFNRHTILNLHALLADNLLGDPTAPGRLRREPVGIGLSVYHPLEVPQLIDECFNRLLATAAAIRDPFEQAFFALIQIPYLQPFLDVNKRVSRLAANIPLIKGNLAPLSFVAVPEATYTQAMLAVYELNRIDPIKDVFLWAYERSSDRYVAIRQSLGEPDPFRLRHRADLKRIVAEIIRAPMDQNAASVRIKAFAADRVEQRERAKFIETAETDLLSLHEGNFARYQIRPSEFVAWRRVWEQPADSKKRRASAKKR